MLVLHPMWVETGDGEVQVTPALAARIKPHGGAQLKIVSW